MLTPDLVKEKILAAKGIGKDRSTLPPIWTSFKKFDQYYRKENTKKFYLLFYPWYTLMVNLDGYVPALLFFRCVPNSWRLFGNIYQEEFMKMFNNEKFRNFRRLLKKGESLMSVVNYGAAHANDGFWS